MTRFNSSIAPHNQGLATLASPRRKTKRADKKKYTKTPPEADGVEGFMFTSPQRRVGSAGTEDVQTILGTTNSGSIIKRSLRSDFQKAANDTPSGKKGGLVSAVSFQRTGTKSSLDIKMQSPVKKKQRHDSSCQPQEDASALFSPYHCSPTKHRYYTRAFAKQQQHVHMDVEETAIYPDHTVVVKKHIDVYEPEPEHNDHQLDISDLETDEVAESLSFVHDVSLFKSDFNGRIGLPPQLPFHKAKITLVLDLDETLVHCSTDKDKLPSYDLKFDVPFSGRNFEVYAQKRPFLIEFLKAASQLFEVVIFTASQKIYADKLLDLIDPTQEWTKDSCVPVQGTFIKDLRVLGRDLSRVIIVDNAVEAFSYQIENGIPIKSWFAESGDKELDRLMSFLQPLSYAPFNYDVREYLHLKLGMRERMFEAKSQVMMKRN